MRKWGNGEMERRYTAFHLANCRRFVTAEKINVYPCTHWEVIFADSWHKGGMQQQCIILCKLIRSSSSSLLAACEVYWICELFIYSNFIQGVISRFLHAVALLWIYLYLPHIQQYYLKTARLLVLMHHRKFTKCLFAVIHTPEYNYCVLIFSLHAQSGGGNVQQLCTCQSETYCVKK